MNTVIIETIVRESHCITSFLLLFLGNNRLKDLQWFSRYIFNLLWGAPLSIYRPTLQMTEKTYSEEMEEFGDQIEWLPEERAELKEKDHITESLTGILKVDEKLDDVKEERLRTKYGD